MRLSLSVLAFCFGGTLPARADWLDDLWSEKSVAEYGNPAITLRAGSADVVVPAPVLDAAYGRGLKGRDVALAVLRRYGPCSDLLDLGGTHHDLVVRLLVQREAPHEDSIVANQESIIAWARQGGGERPGLPRVTRAFEVGPDAEIIVLDYTPGPRDRRCTAADPTS